MSITQKSAVQLIELMEQGKKTSREITSAFLNAIEKNDPQIGSFVRWDAKTALATAEGIDADRAAGKKVGVLAGLPVAIKDILCTSEGVTSCGSKMLAEYRSPYDATSVVRLKEAGAVIVGKTNMDEFAMGCSTENSAFHPTRNPWNHERIPGGSSGGAAACVAGSMAPLSLGSDTGGSIRQPASHCGVVGLKPTYGRVSRFGLIAFGSSLDCIGPLARTAEDAALMLSVISGRDRRDATSLDREVPDYLSECRKDLGELRLGVVSEHFGKGIDPEVKYHVEQAIDRFKKMGALVTPVTLPHSQYAIAAYYIIASSEASSNLARYDGAHYGFRAENRTGDNERSSGVDVLQNTRQQGFGQEVKRGE